MKPQRRQHGLVVAELNLLDVDLRDEEFHTVGDVGAQDLRRALGDVVLLLAQPLLEAVGLLGAEDQDVVLADLELGFDGDAEIFGRASAPQRNLRGVVGVGHRHRLLIVVIGVVAGVLLPVLDESWRRELVDAVEDLVG